jgi:putative ABC transport system ATP-binding protein
MENKAAQAITSLKTIPRGPILFGVQFLYGICRMTFSSSPPILSFQDVDLKLKSDAGDVHILKSVSFALPPSTTISIVGPSGSGKTSLLMVAGGLEPATAGRITACGQDFSGLSEDDLARFRQSNIGIVFQSFHLIPTMNALENVAIPLELAGVADAREKAKEGLRAVGLSHRLTHFPGQLSGGEQQRVAIARAFAPKPKIILADEPTGNLDRETGDMVTKLMFDLCRDHGTTLMLVTHDQDLAARCAATIRIADGRVHV